MSHFCLKQGWDLKAWVAHLYLDFPCVPPPPPAINSSTLLIKLRNDGTIVSCLDQGKV